MADQSRYGMDTNILLRLFRPEQPGHFYVKDAMRHLSELGVQLCYTAQNMGEMWNVSTRPVAKNGLGLTSSETNEILREVEANMTLLPEDPAVYHVWRRLLIEHDVRGVQVHDAHLAATLEVHGIRHLLTFNVADFKRFDRISAVFICPREVHWAVGCTAGRSSPIAAAPYKSISINTFAREYG